MRWTCLDQCSFELVLSEYCLTEHMDLGYYLPDTVNFHGMECLEHDETEIATEFFFHFVTYIQGKQMIIGNENLLSFLKLD